jgi:hypothetical protein
MALSIAVTMGRSTAPLAVFQTTASWAANRLTAATLLDISNPSSRLRRERIRANTHSFTFATTCIVSNLDLWRTARGLYIVQIHGLGEFMTTASKDGVHHLDQWYLLISL